MMEWLLKQPNVSHVEVKAANQYAKGESGTKPYWQVIVNTFDHTRGNGKAWGVITGTGYSLKEAQESLVEKL